MSQSYRSMLFHIIFTTKGRCPWLTTEVRDPLNAYIFTMVNERFGIPIRIGGTEDHVHILIDKEPGVNEPDMMRDIKAFSSGWIHEAFPHMHDFAWQPGYGIFSVSGSHKGIVAKYIENQIEHHKKFNFQEELRRLLERNNVKYDERYIWK